MQEQQKYLLHTAWTGEVLQRGVTKGQAVKYKLGQLDSLWQLLSNCFRGAFC